MKKQIKIKFVDFYRDFQPDKAQIWSRLWQFYDVVISDQPDWLVYSVFGNEHLKYNNCVKIFFTGENQAPDFNLCDYAIGFEHLSFGDRYLRFPLWFLFKNDTDLLLKKHESPALEKKDAFCSFVYSNSNASKERGEFFEALNAYRPVNSGGRYHNNIGGPVDDKLAFQQRHKFAIAFENTSHDGYTTEKLIQAFAAQTVPIYWGDPRVTETFNKDAFINCNDYPDWASVVERVKEIDTNDALWQKMMETPALFDAKIIEKSWNELDNFLTHIFDQDPIKARRFSRDYWALKQLHTRQREIKAYNRSFIGLLQKLYNKCFYSLIRKNATLWNWAQRLFRSFKLQ